MKNKGKLQGKTAFVTGASSGIGEAAAGQLVREGCRVFITARREDRLKELKEKWAPLEGPVEYAAGDITDRNFVKKALGQAHQVFGPLNILVLSAGAGFIKPFDLTSLEDFHSLLEVNSLGVVHCCKEAANKMSPGGSLILITSPAGIYGAKGMTAYALSKGGLVGFARSLALEWAPKRIRVNIISPGFVKTELTQRLYGGLTDVQKQQIEKAYPLGVGSPDDIAHAVSFLASDESSWITGVVLPVDGGLTAGT